MGVAQVFTTRGLWTGRDRGLDSGLAAFLSVH